MAPKAKARNRAASQDKRTLRKRPAARSLPSRTRSKGKVVSKQVKVVSKNLTTNKQGKVVSKRASENGKRRYENVMLWGDAISKARKALDLRGFVPIGGKTEKGQILYAKAKEIYGGASANAKSPCKKRCMFQHAKDQFKSCLIPTIQGETLELLSLLASRAEFAGNDVRANQENVSIALEEARQQLRSLAAAVRTVHDRLVAEAMTLQAQAQRHEQVITHLEQRCKDLDETLVQSEPLTAQTGHADAAAALALFCDARCERQHRVAEFLRSSGENSLAQLGKVQLFDIPTAFKAIEDKRQKQITDYMQLDIETEAKELSSIQECCRHGAVFSARATQEVETLRGHAKKLAEDSKHAIADFAGELNSSCQQIVAIAASAEAQQQAYQIQLNLAAAQTMQQVALNAQARESKARNEHERESQRAMHNFEGLWKGAMDNYFQESVGASGVA